MESADSIISYSFLLDSCLLIEFSRLHTWGRVPFRSLGENPLILNAYEVNSLLLLKIPTEFLCLDSSFCLLC